MAYIGQSYIRQPYIRHNGKYETVKARYVSSWIGKGGGAPIGWVPSAAVVPGAEFGVQVWGLGLGFGGLGCRGGCGVGEVWCGVGGLGILSFGVMCGLTKRLQAGL